MVEKLRGVSAMASVLLSQKKGYVRRLVDAIGGALCAPHMDGDRLCAWEAPPG